MIRSFSLIAAAGALRASSAAQPDTNQLSVQSRTRVAPRFFEQANLSDLPACANTPFWMNDAKAVNVPAVPSADLLPQAVVSEITCDPSPRVLKSMPLLRLEKRPVAGQEGSTDEAHATSSAQAVDLVACVRLDNDGNIESVELKEVNSNGAFKSFEESGQKLPLQTGNQVHDSLSGRRQFLEKTLAALDEWERENPNRTIIPLLKEPETGQAKVQFEVAISILVWEMNRDPRLKAYEREELTQFIRQRIVNRVGYIPQAQDMMPNLAPHIEKIFPRSLFAKVMEHEVLIKCMLVIWAIAGERWMSRRSGYERIQALQNADEVALAQWQEIIRGLRQNAPNDAPRKNAGGPAYAA